LFVAFYGCNTSQDDGRAQQSNATEKTANFDLITHNVAPYALNDTLNFSLLSKTAMAWDSASILLDGKSVQKLFPGRLDFSLLTKGHGVGSHEVVVEVYQGSEKERIKRNVIVLADKEPEIWGFQIKAKFPHDADAFTQGLLYDKGFLYEGTGQKGASELRKVELLTGKVLEAKKVSIDLFGEGIALFNEHLYQLSWQAGVGLVYQKEGLKEVTRFYYSTEGWGLTANDSHLIMSDGSHHIRFIDPTNFQEQHTIEVYDTKGAIGYLNELEWVDDKIYANIWQKDEIVVIDPISGKVEKRIDMKGIFPANQSRPGVLNGIAFDAENRRFFVTGKYWPFLFEVLFMPKSTISS
jgi:glutamine cyclotransferase